MKMNMRLRDVLVLLIAALVFLPSGASAKGPTSAPTSSPTPKPTTASPTPKPTTTANPTPKPTTAVPTTAEPTTTTEICEDFGEKAENYDPCFGYSESCCENSAVTGGCCYVKTYCEGNTGDDWSNTCCASYDRSSSKAQECTDDSDTDSDTEDDLARVLFASVSTAGASAVTGTSMTAALLMMALVVVGYVAFVLVKKHQQKKGASYTWPEEDETTPIVA